MAFRGRGFFTMCRLLSVLLLLVGVCSAAHAESVLTRQTAASAALGRTLPYMVYLPDGYQRGDLNYPVLYLLHGAGGDEMAWAQEGGIKATADRLMRAGEIPPSIIVMPGCRACWWVDGASDKAETAFWQDLVPEIKRRYRVIDGREGRIIAGLSAGGYGAVRFGMRYPDRVAAVAALSPAVYAEAPPEASSARSQPPFLRADGTFDLAAWRAKNYPSLVDAYFRQSQRVAFFLVSGDNDRFGIAYETMTLFKRLFEHQPELTELRIVDGDHSWEIWSRSIETAMRYLYKHCAPPAPSVVAATPGRTEIAAAPTARSAAPRAFAQPFANDPPDDIWQVP